MNYLEYIPGGVARICNYPTQYGCVDVNRLSRAVARFNDRLTAYLHTQPTAKKLEGFAKCFNNFKLTNSDHELLKTR